MTEAEAKVVLGECMCDKCYSKKCDIKCDYAKAHDVAIKALDQVATLRELRNSLAEKEQSYANKFSEKILYNTLKAMIDEILGGLENESKEPL